MSDKIYNWLKEFPGLEMLQRQQVDAVPEGCGLFFRGVTVTDRSHDLLGTPRGKKTYAFRLYRYGDPVDSPVFFLLLGTWAQANEDGFAAALKNARCIRDNGGLALWEADLDITCWEAL